MSDEAARQWLDGGTPAENIPPEVFRAYVDANEESIVWLDPKFNILYANRSFCRDFGIEQGDAAGRNMLDLTDGTSREEMRKRLDQVLQLTPENPTMTADFAGEQAWLSSLFTAYFDSDGRIVAISDRARDHSEKYAAEQALQESNRRLAESNRDLQDFAYIASHDLQEPLRKISAFGDRLSSRYSDALDDRGLDYLARIQSASSRMQTLIDDVLSFSRVATHGKPIEPTDLNDVLGGVLSDLELAIDECGAIIKADDLPVIAVDGSQLRQLLQNLIGNALKFRRPDVRAEVRIEAEAATSPDGEDGWTIRVADNGIGFDEKYLSKIFTVFQRLHGRDDYPGSGVGLAVCRRIVERHGGTLAATSIEGEGSTFSIWLPAEPNA